MLKTTSRVRSSFVTVACALALALSAAQESRSQTPAPSGAKPKAKYETKYQTIQPRSTTTLRLNRVVPANPHQGSVAEIHAKFGQNCANCHGQTSIDKAISWMTVDPLGVATAAADDALRSQLNIATKTGLVVTSVRADSVGASLGIHVNDILLKFGTVELKEMSDLSKVVSSESKEPLKIRLIREGKERSIDVSPEIRARLKPYFDGKFDSTLDGSTASPEYWIGVSVNELDETLRSQLGLKDKTGLVASNVVADSPAAQAGLKVYDILLKIAGKSVADPKELIARVQEAKGEAIALELLRGGKPLTIEVKPAKRPKSPSANPNAPPTDPNMEFFRALTLQPGVVVNPDQHLGNVYLQEVQRSVDLTKPAAQPALEASLKRMSDQIEALRKSIEELKTQRAEKDKDRD